MAPVVRASLILLVVGAVVAPTARAQDIGSDKIARIVQLNRDAVAEIEQKSFAAARLHLLQAVQLGKRHGGADTFLARTYFHLGALAVIAREDRKLAIAWFQRALRLYPDIRPSVRFRAHADVIETFEGAAAAEPTTCKPQCPTLTVDDPPDPDLPAEISGLECRHDDSVDAESPLVVRCAAHESVELTSLYLHYQSGAATRFKEVMMRVTERGWWRAEVPAKDVAGTSVRLYVDGRHGGGKRLRSELGDARHPTTVPVRAVEDCRCAPGPRYPM